VKPHLIGLAGFARSGKSTIGNILAEHGYEQRAFADKLRELAAEVSDEYREAVYVDGYERAKTRHPWVRDLLVDLGAGCRKVLGADVWVDAVLPLGQHDDTGMIYGGFPSFEGYTVVTDVRYANEALRIKQLGGEVWYVQRFGVGPANDEEYRSFKLLPPPDCIIANDGSLEDLSKTVNDALNSY
jgi:hypothetical protein